MKRGHCERPWDQVRSEIMSRMPRCETEGSEDRRTPDLKTTFELDEAEPYYGPTPGAAEAINAILGLERSCSQNEWEAELGKTGTAELLAHALGEASLDTEARSAIALLLLDHADRLPALLTELLARIRWHLRADPAVQSRMRYWWTHMEGSVRVMEALG